MDQAFQMQINAEAKLGVEPTREAGHASWFKGQQIHVDVLGRFKYR